MWTRAIISISSEGHTAHTKGRPLVKPMIVCTTTGYYVSVLGPYLADYRNNDASILTHMLKTNVEEIRDWIRWIVESSNARIKTWKYLSHTLPTNQIPFIGDFVRIVCALSNKYAQPLSQCRDVESDQLEAAKMIHLSKMSNTLKETCGDRKPIEKEIDMEGSQNVILRIFLGKTQTYSGLKYKSRHTSSKKHQLWIRYNESYIDSWYCLCRAGARVVGACSHVAAVLWYLGKELYKDKSVSYGVRNWENMF
ncbi:unnamed protein product [Mytilus coruscus]|uniref:SWIM-type domain-containing protein n=1 Tax=Mytilus coruscus TaxID=42192 RepID=A0A6J8CJ19_MYTCO|nr:unnamed protein product [Mytilus coruscus]